jgi:hypothetical protein
MPTPTLTPLECPDPYLNAAIQGELRALGQLPDENINKPHSVFFACLLRLASVGKAAGIPPGHFVPHIWAAVQAAPRRHRFPAVERQWRNAWRMAVPRAMPNRGGLFSTYPAKNGGAFGTA